MPCVGFLLVTLLLAENSSLKDKRRVVKSILARVRARFNASCSEVDSQNDRDEARLGFSVCGPDARILRSVLNRILNFVEDNVDAELTEYELYCPLIPDPDDLEDCDYDDDSDPDTLTEGYSDRYGIPMGNPPADAELGSSAYQAVLNFAKKSGEASDLYFPSPLPLLQRGIEPGETDSAESDADSASAQIKPEEGDSDFKERRAQDTDSGDDDDPGPSGIIKFRPGPRPRRR